MAEAVIAQVSVYEDGEARVPGVARRIVGTR